MAISFLPFAKGTQVLTVDTTAKQVSLMESTRSICINNVAASNALLLEWNEAPGDSSFQIPGGVLLTLSVPYNQKSLWIKRSAGSESAIVTCGGGI